MLRPPALLALLLAECCLLEAAPASSNSSKKASTLLHLSSASKQETQEKAASLTEVNLHSKWNAGDPLWQSGAPENPQIHGHLLTKHELNPITSVKCLEAKQRDPSVKCSQQIMHSGTWTRKLNAGNYPSHVEPQCHSNGAYFCDPDSMLSVAERKKVTDLLTKLRKENLVTCGPQVEHDPVDKWNYAPFYLGVAIAKDWPLHESDAQSLQAFGKILMGRWNMTYLWDGNAPYYTRCPLSAMLVVLPDRRQAVISTSSCEFICEEMGGPEVVMSTLVNLDSQGLAKSVMAGMTKTYEVIRRVSPMHDSPWRPVENTASTWKSWETIEPTPRPRPWSTEDVAALMWRWGQRVLFAMACILLIISLSTACLVCYMAPGVAKELNKGNVNQLNI